MTNNDKVRESSVPTAKTAETRSRHIERMIQEARVWAKFAQEHSSLSRHRIQEIALESVGFSISLGAHDLAVPSKLCGTSQFQETLEIIYQLGESRIQPLAIEPEGGKLWAHFGHHKLGFIWPRHSWLWPLLGGGATVYLRAITGADEVWKTLGVNVAVGHVAEAIRIVEGGPTLIEVRPEQGDGAVDEPDWPATIPTPSDRQNGRR